MEQNEYNETLLTDLAKMHLDTSALNHTILEILGKVCDKVGVILTDDNGNRLTFDEYAEFTYLRNLEALANAFQEASDTENEKSPE